jgi:quinol-cytochrome oxidoreductase complex cytochrome b subunit
VKLPARTLRWTHTFGLGGTSLVLFSLLALTGILMVLVYQPVPDDAYDSVLTLEGRVAFGPLVRGVHYWSANLLVVVMLLHAARVFLTGGYHRGRRLNWLIGTGLLVAVLGSSFAGYLLPWDQLAFWAITIATGMLTYVPLAGDALERVVRGGAEIGPETLLTFYTFHTTILPAAILVLMGFHFWRVRRAGGVIEPPPGPNEPPGPSAKVLFLPNLLVREVAQALVVVAVVVCLGALAGASLGVRANPGMSPNPVKAPWYFVGVQELLIHLDPAFAVLVFPLLAVAAFAALPWLGSEKGPAGQWFLSAAARRLAAMAAGLAAIVTPALVLTDTMFGHRASGEPTLPTWLTKGLLPLAVAIGTTVAANAWLARRGASRNERLQAIVVFWFVVFVMLTMAGALFRGEGMALVWPWAR